MQEHDITTVVAKLFQWARQKDFAGHDPHDLLNSPLLGRSTSPLTRLIAVQLGRRSIVDLRTILRVPDTENPKALALFLSGLLRGKSAITQDWINEANSLATRLTKMMSENGGWGYPFPWQSRTHFLPRFTPNIVTTSFVGNALIELLASQECEIARTQSTDGENESATLRHAVEIGAKYLVERIPHQHPEGIAFGYAEQDPQIVFNASLLGAEFLLKAGRLLSNDSYIDLARRAAEFVASHQQTDGSWKYGLEKSQTWIDSFHTGFVVVSMKAIADILGDGKLADVANRGFEYYRKTFIEPDFAVRYFANKRYPVDAHALGQAMVSLATFGDVETARKVAEWSIDHMFSPQGYFYYQQHRLFTNRIPYLRWSNAWMFRGLAEVIGEVLSAKVLNAEAPEFRDPYTKSQVSDISTSVTQHSALSTQHSHIWIDLENTPHVPFFVPIIRELRNAGCKVILTGRDFAQTRELAEKAGLDAKFIGSEQGASSLQKAAGIATRAIALAWHLKDRKIDLAVGHGSRGLLLASKLLGVRSLTLYDYEGASVRLFNRLSTYVMTPEAIPFSTLEALGLSQDKHLTYPGLKEEVYTCDFTPSDTILNELHLDPSKIIVTVRPPSSTAHYKSDASFQLFVGIMQLLSKTENVQIVLMPRNRDQRAQLEAEYGKASNVIIPRNAVNGLDLLYHSDLVIGGGGTMNREAAALGVSVVTIFKGPEGAMDRWLIDQGKMIFIVSSNEVLPFVKKRNPLRSASSNSSSVKDTIVATILRLATSSK